MMIMKTKSPPAIRISATTEVRKSLDKAKRLYPALSDPEIFKLGLSKIVTEDPDTTYEKEREEIQRAAAYSVGYDYLSDPEEDIYTEDMGTKVDFS